MDYFEKFVQAKLPKKGPLFLGGPCNKDEHMLNRLA